MAHVRRSRRRRTSADHIGQHLFVSATVGRHLALAPVAFAVTEGADHTLVYANSLFRRLHAAGQIHIGRHGAVSSGAAGDLTPLLDDVFRSAKPLREVSLSHHADALARWSCSVWPVVDSADGSKRLVVEVRDAALIEGARERQRVIAERLLLGALREHDAAEQAEDVSARAQYLAAASRKLSTSLDEATTLDTMRGVALPRRGTWCIVDVVESSGALHRLAVIHPDPTKQSLVRQLEQHSPPTHQPALTSAESLVKEPTVVSSDAGEELVRAAHGEANLRVLREIGFGSLLIVPLIVRGRIQGTITFVSRKGDPPFMADEINLAADLASRCALALDNARLYREADALRLAAETANESKSQFLATMSHELRTPLNAIGGFAELVEMGVYGPVTDKQRGALARIKAGQTHLLMLVNEILNFVRIESGRMEYHMDAVSMLKALDDVVGMLSVVAKEKGIGLTSAPCDAGAIAWADPDRTRQIFLNLVMNAVKFTPAGGTVTVSCAVADDVVVARVADTGPGIPANRIDSIFEPFVQLTDRLAEPHNGVGLGLPISRDLARAMKGDITLESKVGVGSSFTVTLPLAKGRG